MKNVVLFFIFLLGTSSLVNSQPNDIRSLIDKGIKYYDQGNYAASVVEYQKILQKDSNHFEARFELSNSFLALKEYEKCIEQSNRLIQSKSQYKEDGYYHKGLCLEGLNKKQEAFLIFKMGSQEFPKNTKLLYQLGNSYYKMRKLKDAETILLKAVKVKPDYALTYSVLGYVMKDQNQRVKSLMSLYTYLLLEPNGNRAKNCLKLIEEIYNSEITPNPGTMVPESEYSATDKTISALIETKKQPNSKKTAMEFLIHDTKTTTSMLVELNKTNNDAWWNFFAAYFRELSRNKLVEPFCYYIAQSKGDAVIQRWLVENKSKVEAFLKWNSEVERNKDL